MTTDRRLSTSAAHLRACDGLPCIYPLRYPAQPSALTPPEWDAVAEAYTEGATIDGIATAYHVAPATVGRFLRANGLVRSHAEATRIETARRAAGLPRVVPARPRPVLSLGQINYALGYPAYAMP